MNKNEYANIIITHNLFKHNSSPTCYHKKIIVDLIFNEKKHFVSLFKDHLILNESFDFINKYNILFHSLKIISMISIENKNMNYFPMFTEFIYNAIIYKGTLQKQNQFNMLIRNNNVNDVSSFQSNKTIKLDAKRDTVIKGCKDFAEKTDIHLMHMIKEKKFKKKYSSPFMKKCIYNNEQKKKGGLLKKQNKHNKASINGTKCVHNGNKLSLGNEYTNRNSSPTTFNKKEMVSLRLHNNPFAMASNVKQHQQQQQTHANTMNHKQHCNHNYNHQHQCLKSMTNMNGNNNVIKSTTHKKPKLKLKAELTKPIKTSTFNSEIHLHYNNKLKHLKQNNINKSTNINSTTSNNNTNTNTNNNNTSNSNKQAINLKQSSTLYKKNIHNISSSLSPFSKKIFPKSKTPSSLTKQHFTSKKPKPLTLNKNLTLTPKTFTTSKTSIYSLTNTRKTIHINPTSSTAISLLKRNLFPYTDNTKNVHHLNRNKTIVPSYTTTSCCKSKSPFLNTTPSFLFLDDIMNINNKQ